MLSIKKYAAIDIGSNAVRLLISNIIEQKGKPVQFKKNSLVRVPIRLGADVFIKNKISKENTQRILDTMLAFKLLMKSHKVVKYKACATSAMRESANGKKIVDLVLEHAGINIDVIGGEDEAAIIAATDLNKYIDPNKTYLYVDVGGGSTEFTVINQGKQAVSRSFKIGTVRLLNDMVKKETWQELQEWIGKENPLYKLLSVTLPKGKRLNRNLLKVNINLNNLLILLMKEL